MYAKENSSSIFVEKKFEQKYIQREMALKASDAIVRSLENNRTKHVFCYSGGASLQIMHSLKRSDTIHSITCRHEQGEIFSAEGYAKATGQVGVCVSTSGPGGCNLVTGIADAMMDSVPLIAITGQVNSTMIGTDSFQESPMTSITLQITKHNYLILDPLDIPSTIDEAFILATNYRPGPIHIDIPKDIQNMDVYEEAFERSTRTFTNFQLFTNTVSYDTIVQVIENAKRPVLYIGGGAVDASEEVREFVHRTQIPVTETLMGLGTYDGTKEESLGMLGMHGSVKANYAIDKADVLIAIGVRFDDRVTGKVKEFASRATIIHIDIDQAEINKIKEVQMSMIEYAKTALQNINRMIAPLSFPEWIAELNRVERAYPMQLNHDKKYLTASVCMDILYQRTHGNAIITTGVGTHQMIAAQHYRYRHPRTWLTSGGAGSMGVGLPFSIGAALGRDDLPVIDFDGDGSFVMNQQELATCVQENFPVKIMILNNEILGMVVQWEDNFYEEEHAFTHLGHIPDFTIIAKAYGIPAERVITYDECVAAIDRMMSYNGPYLLDICVSDNEHALPFIPAGETFQDTILDTHGTRIGKNV